MALPIPQKQKERPASHQTNRGTRQRQNPYQNTGRQPWMLASFLDPPKEPVVVQDDSGQFLERMPDGTHRPYLAPDPFKGAREAVEGLPAAEGLSLMGLVQQVARGFLGVAGTAAGAARGDPTAALDPVDVLDMGLGIGTGMTAVGGSLGVFGSRIPRTGSGLLSKGRRGHLYHEIDDSNLRMTWAENARKGQGNEWLLTDVIDHPELFEVYPELKSVKVLVDPTMPHSGSYDDSLRAVSINPQKSTSTIQTLVHEIQHVIQDIDTHDDWMSPRSGGTNQIDAAQDAIELYRMLDDIVRQGGSERLTVEQLQMYKELKKPNLDYDLYARNPGEIEAQVAEQRINLTPTERATRPPDFRTSAYTGKSSLDLEDMINEVGYLHSAIMDGQKPATVTFGRRGVSASQPPEFPLDITPENLESLSELTQRIMRPNEYDTQEDAIRYASQAMVKTLAKGGKGEGPDLISIPGGKTTPPIVQMSANDNAGPGKALGRSIKPKMKDTQLFDTDNYTPIVPDSDVYWLGLPKK